MTLHEFEQGLKEAAPGLVYELAAPSNVNRFAVWHCYGASSVIGDNRNQVDARKVQIDIITKSSLDPLVDDICAALWLMDLPYSVQSEGYDDDYKALRTILQLVVI